MSEKSTRYLRQVTLDGFGPTAQSALEGATVAFIGAGGLGSPAIEYLAAAGVGHLLIIDDDTVELSNLHRQIVHPTANLGESKAHSAARTALNLNPSIRVTPVTARLTWDNARSLLADATVVFDGSDNFATRHVVSATCVHLGVPHVWGSILGFDAQLSVFWADHGPIYEDLYPNPPAPGAVPNCAESGVLGPVVGVVGTAMALETIKLITSVGTPLTGRVATFEGLTGLWDYVPLVASGKKTQHIREHGPITQGVPTVPEVLEGVPTVDVREVEEFREGHIPGATNVPLSRIMNDATLRIPGPAVVYCAVGVRSAQAIELLQQRGDSGLISLRGGFNHWQETAGEGQATSLESQGL